MEAVVDPSMSGYFSSASLQRSSSSNAMASDLERLGSMRIIRTRSMFRCIVNSADGVTKNRLVHIVPAPAHLKQMGRRWTAMSVTIPGVAKDSRDRRQSYSRQRLVPKPRSQTPVWEREQEATRAGPGRGRRDDPQRPGL